jgi:MFS family permease
MSPGDSSSSPTSRLPGTVRVLGGVSLANDIASEIIYPLLPIFLIQYLGGDRRILGLIEGIGETVSSLVKLWSGGRSDRVGGRKGFLLCGYGLAVLVRPVTAILTAPWQLFAVRLSDRIGKGIRTAPRDAMLADATPQAMHGRAFGFHRAMDHLGAAIGPLLAFVFLYYWPTELRLLFFLTLIPSLFVMFLLFFGLRETPSASTDRSPVRLSLRPFGGNFRLYLLALLLFTLGNSSDLFLVLRSHELGVPVAYLLLMSSVFHVLKSIGNVLCGRLSDRFGPKPLILLGWLLYAAIYLAFAQATSAWEAWVFFLAYALYYALTEPAEKVLVTRLAGAERKGLAFGWYHCILGVAALPASVAFGWLYQTWGALLAFSTGAGLALLAMLTLLLVRVPGSVSPRDDVERS